MSSHAGRGPPLGISTAPSGLNLQSSGGVAAPLSRGIGGVPVVTRGIALVILGLSVAALLVPGLYDVLAMIPGSTLGQNFYVWNVLTGGFFEPHLLGAALSAFGFVIGGSLLEPVWGGRELLVFVVGVNFVACVLTFGMVFFCFVVTHNHDFLTAHVAGFKGIIGALTIAVRQLYLDRPRKIIFHPRFPVHLSTQHLPFAYIVVSFIEECIIEGDPEEFPLTVIGIWVGWFYLRNIQRLKDYPTKGDPRENFAFAFIFPFPLRIILSPLCNLTHQAFSYCGLLDKTAVTALANRPVPPSSLSKTVPLGFNVRGAKNSDAANKRRERGYQMLELRLASLKSQEEGFAQMSRDHQDTNQTTSSSSTVPIPQTHAIAIALKDGDDGSKLS